MHRILSQKTNKKYAVDYSNKKKYEYKQEIRICPNIKIQLSIEQFMHVQLSKNAYREGQLQEGLIVRQCCIRGYQQAGKWHTIHAVLT